MGRQAHDPFSKGFSSVEIKADEPFNRRQKHRIPRIER
jgi:hypothetical protein